jgi:hypothetical protein
MKKVFFASVFMFLNLMVLAQFPPRIDDHFYRKKFFTKIDFAEKINVNLTYYESPLYTKGKYGETNGLVNALLNAFKDHKITGYKYDSLSSPMSYEEFANKMNSFAGKSTTSTTTTEGFGDETDEESMDEGDEETGDETTEATSDGGKDDVMSGSPGRNTYAASLEYFMGIIEDRIFRKDKSDMYYDYQYIVLFYTEPTGVVPEEPAVAFSYKEIMDILNDTQYKNRSNDAEYRTLQEIFELRLYHAFTINVSGENVNTLDESKLRDTQIVEYEHHLWNF